MSTTVQVPSKVVHESILDIIKQHVKLIEEETAERRLAIRTEIQNSIAQAVAAVKNVRAVGAVVLTETKVLVKVVLTGGSNHDESIIEVSHDIPAAPESAPVAAPPEGADAAVTAPYTTAPQATE